MRAGHTPQQPQRTALSSSMKEHSIDGGGGSIHQATELVYQVGRGESWGPTIIAGQGAVSLWFKATPGQSKTQGSASFELLEPQNAVPWFQEASGRTSAAFPCDSLRDSCLEPRAMGRPWEERPDSNPHSWHRSTLRRTEHGGQYIPAPGPGQLATVSRSVSEAASPKAG